MKKKLIIILVVCCCFLCGCINISDLSSIIFIDSIGIDYDDETDEFVVYAHTTSPNTLTTAEQGSSEVQNKTSYAKGSGKTFFEGFKKIVDASSSKLSLSHIKSYIITEKLFKLEAIEEMYLFIKFHYQIYPIANFYVTRAKLEDLMKTDNPESVSPYFSLLGNQIRKSFYDSSNYTTIISQFLEKQTVIRMLIIDTSEDIWNEGKDSINSVYISGVAFLNKNNNNLFILEDEHREIIWLNNLSQAEIDVPNIGIFSFSNYGYRTFIENNIFHINISCQTRVTNIHKLSNDEMIKGFEETVKNDVTELYQYGIDNEIDILGINDLLYRYNLLTETNTYKNQSIKISVKCTITSLNS